MNDGGFAFPRPSTADTHGYGEEGAAGMTLRDYFAAAALQGMLASESVDSSYESTGAAMRAFGMADAMLKERQK